MGVGITGGGDSGSALFPPFSLWNRVVWRRQNFGDGVVATAVRYRRQWVEMKSSRRDFAKQVLALGAMVSATPLWSQAGPAVEPYNGTASLKAHAKAHGLYAGAAVNVGLLARDAVYKQTLMDQYNIVVAENAMKWAGLRPAPDKFDFVEADAFVAFAEANGMAVRGHNLCWHEALPQWFAATVNKANAQQYLTTHIATVAGRYKGKIRAWDVVNEAIDPKDGQPDSMRNSPWYKLLGPSYIDTAFRAARAADPAALLTYNDYGIETDSADDTAKRNAVLSMMRRMKKENVPIDAVGIQSHISAASVSKIGAGLEGFVADCAALGLKVFVTELDVNDDGLMVEDAKTRALLVGAVYTFYIAMLLKNKAVTDVLTWGVSDKSSWLNGQYKGAEKFRPKHPGREEMCLPFDDEYRPNPAFFGLRGALDSRR